jgi:hypothetical protein
MDRACSTDGGGEKYKNFVGKPERKRPIGKTKNRWEDAASYPMGTRCSFPGDKAAGA